MKTDEDGWKTISVAAVTPYLVEAVKHQDQIIAALTRDQSCSCNATLETETPARRELKMGTQVISNASGDASGVTLEHDGFVEAAQSLMPLQVTNLHWVAVAWDAMKLVMLLEYVAFRLFNRRLPSSVSVRRKQK